MPKRIPRTDDRVARDSVIGYELEVNRDKLTAFFFFIANAL